MCDVNGYIKSIKTLGVWEGSFYRVKNWVRYENGVDRVFWKKFGSDYIKIPPPPKKTILLLC